MLLGKQIIRKNRMTKRHKDPRLFLLGSVPTQNDIHIVTSKLTTNKQVGLLLPFIAKNEEFDQTKNKKLFHHNHLHLLEQMIVMRVDRQNYWQALQLLLLHFFLISSACSSLTWGVITGCSLSGLRARKLLGKKIFLANALFGITGFSELANSPGK